MKKLALIGLGVMGNYYLETTKLISDCKIEQICAKSNTTLKKYPSSFNKTTDFKKIGPADGIIIATPASTHFEISKFFIKKNIPLLIEKPLTTNYKNALSLERLGKKFKANILVGHSLLYHAAYLKLKKNISEIGNIKRIIFEGANSKPRSDTNVLYDWGSHGASLILDILNTFPRRIIFLKPPKLKKEISLVLVFPGNIEAVLNLSWVSKIKKRKLIIEGTRGSVIFDDRKEKKLTISMGKKVIFPKINRGEPLENELKDFLNILTTGRKVNNYNLVFGVKVIKLLDRIEKAAQNSFQNALLAQQELL